MKLEQVIRVTGVARAGMTVRDMFEECVRTQVQALPYCDANGKVIGRVTLKNLMKDSILPEYMAELPHLLGDEFVSLQDVEATAKAIMEDPVEKYALEEPQSMISPETPLIKALAVMVRNDTSYLFVVRDGIYQGIVTIQGIASRMLAL